MIAENPAVVWLLAGVVFVLLTVICWAVGLRITTLACAVGAGASFGLSALTTALQAGVSAWSP